MKDVNVAIIGGSGFWSDESHHKHILELKKSYPIGLKAVVDFVDPYSVKHHKNLQSLLETDKPDWINPSEFANTDQLITALRNRLEVNLVIIACNPVGHFDYGMSCIRENVNAICDKPIISSPNASTEPESAQKIRLRYDLLLQAYIKAKRKNPHILFHTILRRRSLTPFIKVAEELTKVYEKTGAGFNVGSITVNGGKYKLPAELAGTGAHGYLDGVGSLSHSAYHYIDVLAWFLKCAPGSARSVVPKLNYVFRIGDYLKAKSYHAISRAIQQEGEAAFTLPTISENVKGCELNAGFTFTLYDDANHHVGHITFLFNLLTFSPRTVPYDPSVSEPADTTGGGRTSHILIDLHQDGLQSWEMIKNDVVFEGNKIKLHGRRHPNLEGSVSEEYVYEKAYEPEITLKDLLGKVVESIAETKVFDNHDMVRDLSQERLATDLYGACYELLANDFAGNHEFRIEPINLFNVEAQKN